MAPLTGGARIRAGTEPLARLLRHRLVTQRLGRVPPMYTVAGLASFVRSAVALWEFNVQKQRQEAGAIYTWCNVYYADVPDIATVHAVSGALANAELGLYPSVVLLQVVAAYPLPWDHANWVSTYINLHGTRPDQGTALTVTQYAALLRFGQPMGAREVFKWIRPIPELANVAGGVWDSVITQQLGDYATLVLNIRPRILSRVGVPLRAATFGMVPTSYRLRHGTERKARVAFA